MAAFTLEEALAAIGRGWALLPLWWPLPNGQCACGSLDCPKPGKHPLGILVPHGCNDATRDPAFLSAWWHRFPYANVGIATGQASGLHVLDIDPRHGGDETLHELVGRHGPLPSTIEVVTGSGGRHIYFQAPLLRIGCPSLGQGIDTRGDGGLVVAPPSLHVSGRRYEWEVSSHPDAVPPAPLPAWLLARLVGVEEGPRMGLEPATRLPLGKRALDFVANGAPVSEQRLRAVAAARNYLSAGYTVESTAAALWRGLQASPVGEEDHPWYLRDAEEIARDIAARPAPQLRSLPGQPRGKRSFLPTVEVVL